MSSLSEQPKPSCRVLSCSVCCARGPISSSLHLSSDQNATLGQLLNNENPTKIDHSFKLDLGTFHPRTPKQDQEQLISALRFGDVSGPSPARCPGCGRQHLQLRPPPPAAGEVRERRSLSTPMAQERPTPTSSCHSPDVAECLRPQ